MRWRSPLLLAGLVVLLPACGHKGDPLPPRRMTPPAPPVFRLAQRGDAIELLSRAPTASVDGVAYDAVALEFLYGAGQVDLEKAGTHLLVRSAAGAPVAKTVALPAPGTLLRAAARAIASGEKGPRSLTKALVAQAPLEAPHELVARVVEDGVALAWRGVRPKEVAPPPTPMRPSAPGPPASRTPGAPTATRPPETLATVTAGRATPSSGTATTTGAEAQGSGEAAVPVARRNGFFLYRRRDDAPYGAPLASEPLELRNHKDTTAPLQTRVCYVARAVASSDPLIESGPSNEACVVMRDITPPAAPAGIAVLPRAAGLELIWSPSGEQDLAGYRVLRSSPGGDPRKIADLEPGKTSYLDESAQRGARYSYSIVAVDQAGNQSARSEAVEAALP